MLDEVPRFSGRPVLVVGDIMLDEFVWGRNSRVSPEAPVPILEVERRTYSPGGAANVAANIQSLRGIPQLMGVTGSDIDAEKLGTLLTDRSIFTGRIQRLTDRPTTVKTRILADGKQVARIDQEVRKPLPAYAVEMLTGYAIRALPNVRAAVVSDYGKGVVSPGFLGQFLAAAKATGTPTIIDPKGTDYLKYRGATLVKPNHIEAGDVLGRYLVSNDDVEAAGAELVNMLGRSTAVLITRGSDGMTLFRHGKPSFHMPAHVRHVFDVTGAGDTVAAVIALAMGIGLPLPHACELANRAAAIVVQKTGTATLTQAELRNPLATRTLTMPLSPLGEPACRSHTAL